MKINEHQKKGCEKVMDSERNYFKLKLYPPLKNATKGVYIVKGGNIMEYRVKVSAFFKQKNSRRLTTLTLQPIQTSKHKLKKEKAPPLDICNEVQKEFVVACKKCLMKHGGQAVKQVLKPKKIFKHITSLKPLT
jgi:hypothetical protein